MIAIEALALCLSLSAGQTGEAALEAKLDLLATNPDSVADLATAAAERMGGWMSRREDALLEVRIPADSLEAMVAVASASGRRIGLGRTTTDLSSRIAELTVSVKCKDSLLEGYRSLVAGSGNPSQLRDVERRAASLAGQVGRARNELASTLSRVRWATLELRLGSFGAAPPQVPSPSPFEWIENLNLATPDRSSP